jgi:hypothetical protein
MLSRASAEAVPSGPLRGPLVLELGDGPLSPSFFRCVLATMCALSPRVSMTSDTAFSRHIPARLSSNWTVL